MRQPAIQPRHKRVQISGVKSYPAPVGGWNARDALADMKPYDAVTLENWFPNTSYVEVRGGYATSATGLTNKCKTLAVYNALTGSNKMFAATNSGVYDVSLAGAVGASVAARTNGKHQWLMFGDGTSNWLIMMNGVDKPLYYDGTTWTAVDGGTTPALTGVTTTNIISACNFKNRLIFILKNQLGFWYLPAAVAGGALAYFDLSGIAKKGGYLMAMGTWTVDAGNGPDDRAVFVTSEGEVIVYTGNNPASATAWSLVGVYFVGRPIGRRCLLQIGGDIAIITENGVLPLSAALQSAAIDYHSAVTDKIRDAFTAAARLYSGVFGWEATLYPAHAAMIVNVPHIEDGEHEQFVMNTMTGSWCKFTEWDAETFAVFNGELYFGNGTSTYKAWTGMVDGANDIVAYGKTAFTNLGSEGLKDFKMFRPILATNGSLSFLVGIDVDYEDTIINGTATYTVVSGAVWDVSKWDQANWASSLEVLKDWTTPSEWPGFTVSGKIKVATNTLTIQWISCDYVYERGAVL